MAALGGSIQDANVASILSGGDNDAWWLLSFIGQPGDREPAVEVEQEQQPEQDGGCKPERIAQDLLHCGLLPESL